MSATPGILVLLWLMAGATVTAADLAPSSDDWSERPSATGLALRQSTSRETIAPLQEPQQPAPSEKPKPRPVEVTGTVRNRGGNAVADAKISIKGPDGYQALKVTNARGAFTFEGLDGAYQIEIEGEPKPFPAVIATGRLSPNEFTVTK